MIGVGGRGARGSRDSERASGRGSRRGSRGSNLFSRGSRGWNLASRGSRGWNFGSAGSRLAVCSGRAWRSSRRARVSNTGPPALGRFSQFCATCLDSAGGRMLSAGFSLALGTAARAGEISTAAAGGGGVGTGSAAIADPGAGAADVTGSNLGSTWLTGAGARTGTATTGVETERSPVNGLVYSRCGVMTSMEVGL